MRGLHRCAAVFATVLVAGAAAPSFRVQGVVYTIHASTHRELPIPGFTDTGYTARVTWTAARGRMDIVSGAQRPIFSQGDYVLFDTTGYVIVHPASRTYSTEPDLSGASMAGAEQMRNAMKITDVKLSVDTLEKGAMINGFRTAHYRTHTSFTTTIDMSAFGAPADATPPSSTVESVADYWYADTVAALANPFESTSRSLPAMLGPMKELFDRMASLKSAMPLDRLAVRTVTSSVTNSSSRAGNGETVTDITDLAHTDVDASRLVLPADYVLAPLPGAEMFGAPKPLAPEVLAKWRTAPKG